MVFAEATLYTDAHGTITVQSLVQKDVRVNEGWNLLQGLADPGWIVEGPGLVSRENIKVVFGLHPATKEYVRFFPSPEKEKIDALGNIPRMTYWVFSERGGMLKYSTAQYSETRNELTFQRTAGWNIVSIIPEMFVGEPYAGGTFSWNSIKGTCDIQKVYAWNPEAQNWMPISVNQKSNDFNDFLGMGMVVKMGQMCQLARPFEYNMKPPRLPR